MANWLRCVAEDSGVESGKDAKLTSDYRLMRRVVAGDQDAKRTLLTMLYRRVNARVRYLCSGDAEAEDLTQDTLLQILKAAPRFRADGCLEAWADVITVRTVTRTMGRVRRLRRLFRPRDVDTPSPLDSPEQDLGRRDRQERVHSLLRRLPSEWREAVILKLMYGYSAKEVAHLTGTSLKTVQYHIKLGRAELRRLALKDARIKELFPEVPQ